MMTDDHSCRGEAGHGDEPYLVVLEVYQRDLVEPFQLFRRVVVECPKNVCSVEPTVQSPLACVPEIQCQVDLFTRLYSGLGSWI